MNLNTFQIVFSRLITRSNLSEAEIARRLGVNRSTINRWKTGEQSPPLSKIPAIADLFDVHPTLFVGNTNESSELIKKFTALDTKGKHTVMTVLNIEYDRCTGSEINVIAAHNDDYSEEQQDLMLEDIEAGEKLHNKKMKQRSNHPNTTE